jgi:hypothetical protein
VGAPGKPGGPPDDLELDLTTPNSPASTAPAPAQRVDEAAFLDDASLELELDPTTTPAVAPSRLVPDLSVEAEPVSGRFTGLLLPGNVLEDEQEIALVRSPAETPRRLADDADARGPMEIEPGFGDLSWTLTPVPPASGPPPTPRPARPTPMRRTPAVAQRTDPELRKRIEESWFRSTSWPGMTDEQRRVAITRSTLDVLSTTERSDSLADGIVHALLQVPLAIHGRAQFLQDAIVARLPRRALLGACTLLARWAPGVAEHEGPAAERWLDAAAHIAESAAVTHARTLEEGGIELLRALEEDGQLLTRRMDPEVRDWVRAGRYLRTDAAQARAATAGLDTATAADEYAAEVGAAERAVQFLTAAGRWETLAPLVTVLAHHATAPDPFAQRAQLAAAALDRIYSPQVLAPMVLALAEGTTAEGSLLRVFEAGGARVVEATVAVMLQTPAITVRRAAGSLLRAHPVRARAYALELLERSDLPASGRRTAYEVLGDAGQPEDAQLLVRDRDHPSEEVRCAVLWAAAALVRDRAEGLLLRAVDDPSPVVQARAVNLLGQLRATQRNVLDRLAQIIEDPSPPEDAETLIAATLWALGHIGNVPLPGRGASVEGLLSTLAGRVRPAGLRRVLGTRSAEMWWRPSVRVALCRALAALDTDRARAVLRRIGDSADDPARDEARHILAQRRA